MVYNLTTGVTTQCGSCGWCKLNACGANGCTACDAGGTTLLLPPATAGQADPTTCITNFCDENVPGDPVNFNLWRCAL